jgi:hypothetical protein
VLMQLTTGDALKLLAPLEPRPAGMALPRSLTLDLQMTPQMATPGEMSSVLFRQSFLFTVPLPRAAAPINIDEYLPPGHRQRFGYAPGADDSTLEANIASARASQYSLENDFDRSIYWQKQGLATLAPFTSTAQFHRLGLAHTYEEAGDAQRAAQGYREVITISQQHPNTWNYYAWQAGQMLKYMTTHKSRRWVGKKRPGGNTLARTPSGRPPAPH